MLLGTFECIARVGIGKTTMEDAARRVGCSPGPPCTACSRVGATSSSARRSRGRWPGSSPGSAPSSAPRPTSRRSSSGPCRCARAGPRARGAPEGARDRARTAHAPHHRRAAPRDLLHRRVLPAAPRARPGRRPARGRGAAGEQRRVHRPDGAVAHRLARAVTTSRTPTRSAASSAGSSWEVSWPDHSSLTATRGSPGSRAVRSWRATSLRSLASRRR